MPRKMLPPPSTIAISTPRLWTSMSSSAICASVAESMPFCVEPMSASPESLSRMRRYFTPGASGSLVSLSAAPEALRRGSAASPSRGLSAGAPLTSPLCPGGLFSFPLAIASVWLYAWPACFWTSATKSSALFSRPSPTSKRTKRRILMFSPVLATSSVSSARMSFLPSGSFTQT